MTCYGHSVCIDLSTANPIVGINYNPIGRYLPASRLGKSLGRVTSKYAVKLGRLAGTRAIRLGDINYD